MGYCRFSYLDLYCTLYKPYSVQLGFNSKNDTESSEKSKIVVGIRTEIDHVNKIVTQDQTQFSIDSKSSSAIWLGRASKAFFAAGAQRTVSEAGSGAKVEAKFLKRFRSKTAFWRMWQCRHVQMCWNVESQAILNIFRIAWDRSTGTLCSKGSSPSQRSRTRM
jgi:hypothetical protein